MQNSVDPDKQASKKPSDLGLHCLSSFSMIRVKHYSTKTVIQNTHNIDLYGSEIILYFNHQWEIRLHKTFYSNNKNHFLAAY